MEKKMKIYVSPSANRKGGYTNPYFLNLKRVLLPYFELLEKESKPCLTQSTALLFNAFKADVFLLSFVENIAFHKLKYLQFLLVCLSLFIIKIRRKKIIFIFHNIRPHKGENYISTSITRQLLKLSHCVICHSREAETYVEKEMRMIMSSVEYISTFDSKVKYYCHPVAIPPLSSLQPCCITDKQYDIFIWGSILPYKGIHEFLSFEKIRTAAFKIHILGECEDKILLNKILSISNNSGAKIVFDNRRADFDEIAQCCRQSRFVLFPYLPYSVSSSGALIDTIAMGGIPLGPDIGAFKDLREQKVAFTYKDYEELFSILSLPGTLHSESSLPKKSGLDEGNDYTIKENNRLKFIAENSWENFAKQIFEISRKEPHFCNGFNYCF